MRPSKFAELHLASRPKLEAILEELRVQYDTIVHQFRNGKDLAFAKSISHKITDMENVLSNFENTNKLYARMDRVLEKVCELSEMEPVIDEHLLFGLNSESKDRISRHRFRTYFMPKMDGIGLFIEFEASCYITTSGDACIELNCCWIIRDDIAYDPNQVCKSDQADTIARFTPGFSRKHMFALTGGSFVLNYLANGFIDQMIVDICDAIDTVDPDLFKKMNNKFDIMDKEDENETE